MSHRSNRRLGSLLCGASFLGLALVTGCADDALDADEGAGGTGGSGASDAGGAGAGAGAGGGGHVAACTQLVQTGEVVPLPRPTNTMSVGPKLHPLADGRMAVVYTKYIPGMGPIATTSETIDWTGSWPPSTSEPVELVAPPGFVAPLGIDGAEAIPILAAVEPAETGPWLGFGDPENGGWDPQVLADTGSPAWTPTVLVGDGLGNFLIGMAGPYDPVTSARPLLIGWVATEGTPTFEGPVELPCKAGSDAADAVATEDGWLVARSMPGPECFDTSPITWQMKVTHFVGTEGTPGFEADLPMGAGYEVPRLFPRPGGAWLLYGGQLDGLVAVGLDSSGQLALGPYSIYPQNMAGDAYQLNGFAPLDDGLIVAYQHGPSEGPVEQVIVVTNAEGATIATAQIDLGPDASVGSPAGPIAFDPITRQVLFAMAGSNATDSLVEVRVARFSCE